MTLNEINSKYILSDGQIISCAVNFTGETFAIINLKVREQIGKMFKDVFLQLKFNSLTEFNLFEDFTTENYSDITFLKLENGEYYLSLDPYENSREVNEKDNFIVKAKSLEITVANSGLPQWLIL